MKLRKFLAPCLVLVLFLLPLLGFTQENTLPLCLDGMDNDGDGAIDCLDEDCLAFIQCAQKLIYIPNAFSPDDDGSNDIFVVYGGEGIKVIRYFGVFNRLGQVMHEAYRFFPNDPSYGWDGAFRGQRKRPGIYLYVVEAEFVDGTVHQFTGDVLLMK